MSSSITVNGYEIIGDLVPNQPIAVFNVSSTHDDVVTVSSPNFALMVFKEHLAVTTANQKIVSVIDNEITAKPLSSPMKAHVTHSTMAMILTIAPEYQIDLLRLSIQTIQSQIQYYEEQQFKELIKQFSPDKPELYERGAILMKNEIETSFKGICSSLLIALNNGKAAFYEHFIATLTRLNSNQDFNAPQNRFFDKVIQQHYLRYKDEESNNVEHPTPYLYAAWLKPILQAMWLGELQHRAFKSPKLQRNVNELFLDLAHIKPTIDMAEDGTKEDRIFFDFLTGELTAGLSANVVEKVLKQHNQAIVIDLLKLFTTLWNEHADIQRTRCFNIPDRWNGLAAELNQRYGVAINEANKQKIKDSCRLLEALRYGTSWEDHSKFLAFGGRKRNEQLFVSYMEGFWQPLTKHERLIPILNHPKGVGHTRSRYNRFGLALGSWLVNHSHVYHQSDGLGVQLDKAAYDYFRQRVGFNRKSEVDKAIAAFEEYGAVQKNGNLLGLGVKNNEGAKLIMDGAKRSIDGYRGGIASGKKRRKKKR